MARFLPFCGVRYGPSEPLDQVVAPPYDVIEPDERRRLAERHPHNAVHLELPEAPGGADRYRHAHDLFEGWLSRGVLRADPEPSFYLYAMEPEGGPPTTGVLGLLGISDEEAEGIRPHEQTLPKPLGDRLKLLEATRVNVSPIWALARGGGLGSALEPPGPPTAEARDDDGVRHRLWRIVDPASLEAIAGAVEAGPLVVADGHHRYQTARHYHHEAGDEASGLLLAFVVDLAPGHLQVGAIHRLLVGFDGPSSAILDAFRHRFHAVRAGPLDPQVVRALEGSASLALLVDDGVWLLTEAADDSGANGHDVLDPELVGPALEALGSGEVVHAHRAHEATEAVRRGEAQAAVLLRPVTVEQIGRFAAEGRTMPPKTTYFVPKPRTGMVFRRLDEA